jgi:4-amino-4-deoxy-L-arabinose transferase-like glycosyltransferase
VTAWANRRRGPLAITLAFLVLGMMNLIVVPPFAPRDESSHVAYALAIGDGRFPRIDDTNPGGAIPGLEPFKTWTANHPPLFYALSAIPLEAGKAIGEPLLGLRSMRLLNLLFGAVAVFLAGSLGALLLPRRPEAPILASAGLGLAGSVANTLAVAYNDGLGLAIGVAILVVGLRILREGPSRRLLIALALLAAVGGLAKFTVFLAIGFAALLAAAGVYLARPARRLVAAGATFLLPFAAAAVASGWWYLRNRREYGSITGTDFIIKMQGRGPHAGYLELLQTPWFWRKLHSDIWGAFVRSGSLAGWPREIPEAVTLVGVACLLVALARWFRSGRPRPDLRDAIAWTLLGAFAVLSVWQIVQFYTTGGNAHVRYLYAALPVAGALSAIAFRVLPGNRRNTITIIVIGGSMVLDLYLLRRFCNEFDPGADTGPVGIVGAVLLAGTFVLVARELRRIAPGST